MKFKFFLCRIVCSLMLCGICISSAAHDIYFCGEKIPIDDELIKDKLMNFIKKQINYVNLPSLRERINQYMPQVEKYLQQYNLPQDFKYLAIVESGFKLDAQSGAGAAGFWQLMPATARQYQLIVNDLIDERKDFHKATMAACKELTMNYSYIQKRFSISSWVLTAAAYNNGIGIIANKIKSQGNNYFTMSLNPETAAYVYKIIAVKELFEFPELYMDNFGFNVFSKTATNKKTSGYNTDLSAFSGMKFDIDLADGQHPKDLSRGLGKAKINKNTVEKFITARIKGKYKHFKDGDIINIVLEDNLVTSNSFTSANSIIQGKAWIIDERVMVDLGHGHEVLLLDINQQKGIPRSRLKNNEPLILKITTTKK